MEEEARDSRLDVNSADFDPFLALYSDSVVLPRPDALVLDNVAKYESLAGNSEGSLIRIDEILQKKLSKKKQPEPSTSKESEPRFSKAQGYQEAAPETKKRSKPVKNVLTRISRASGPLAFLRDCMEKRIRIKCARACVLRGTLPVCLANTFDETITIGTPNPLRMFIFGRGSGVIHLRVTHKPRAVWTRNASGLRGYCMGFLIAFDKHWNLALSDVKEVWSRRVKRKRIIFGKEFELPKEWKVLGPMVTPPKVVVLNTEKGMQTCERHVNQMLMRGEHIAFISVTDA